VPLAAASRLRCRGPGRIPATSKQPVARDKPTFGGPLRISEVIVMFAYLLLIGGILYGSAAFAGSGVYVLAGIALGAWLAVMGGRYLWRDVVHARNR
jgi:hypothetical protein